MKKNFCIASTLVALLVALGLGQGVFERRAEAQAKGAKIMVVDPHTIFVEKRGRLVRAEARFTDDEAVRSCIERIVTPLGRRIDFEAGLDRVDGRKIFCWGKSWDGDTLLCEATILFVAPRDGLMPG